MNPRLRCSEHEVALNTSGKSYPLASANGPRRGRGCSEVHLLLPMFIHPPHALCISTSNSLRYSGERVPERSSHRVVSKLASRCPPVSSRVIGTVSRARRRCVSSEQNSRMHWTQQFQPGKPAKMIAPDVDKQPHQPQLSGTREPLRKVLSQQNSLKSNLRKPPRNSTYACRQVLASAGIASYQKCRSIVLGGGVTVNGIPERHPQRIVDVLFDKILVKGRLLEPERDHMYILLHKSSGVLGSVGTVTNQPVESLQNVVEALIPETLRHVQDVWHMVWRLSVLSSGLQLVTSDQNWARQVMAKVDGMFLLPCCRTLRRLVHVCFCDFVHTRETREVELACGVEGLPHHHACVQT